MDIEELGKQNPWWARGRIGIEGDRYLEELKKQRRIYTFSNELEKGIYVFRGPRQVGKTTWLKTRIKKYIDKGGSTVSVFFYSCDLIKKPAELAEVLNLYYKEADFHGIKEHEIFLDEVTGILEWGNAIKYIANTRDIRRDIFVITGSSAVDLRKGAERLPGRGIEGKEYEFLPLSFREYGYLIGEKLPFFSSPEGFFEAEGIKESIVRELSPFFLNMPALNNLLHKYMQTGGFLKALNAFEQKGNVEDSIFEVYARWLESDISKANRNSVFAKQAAAAVLSQGSSTFSLSSIAKKTSLQTHVSAGEYLALFEDMMLLNVLYKIDRSKKMPIYRKEKKVYFRDPFIVEVMSRWTEYTDDVHESVIVEHMVLEHLSRLFGKSRLFFYNDGKKEVDAVVHTKNGDLIPIEVKWQNEIRSSDLEGLYSFGRGILLTKNRFEIHKERYLLMPVALFLLLLDIKPFIRVKLV